MRPFGLLPSASRGADRAAARMRVVSAALAGLLAVTLGAALPVAGADPPIRTLVPIGASYDSDTLQRFARAAVTHDTSGRVVLLVLPISYATNATSITNGERQKNLTLADTRRGQIETACNAVRTSSQACQAFLVPILTRSDAYLASNLDYFTPDVDGIFILGGDQTVAMAVVADTPFEEEMAEGYYAGAVVGGNSAGDAVQSVNMIAGYTGNNGPAQGLQEGAVDLWASSGVHDPTRGLIFGLANAVTEQHVYQRGRVGRAFNVSVTTGLPILAEDESTAATIVNEQTLTDVVGYTSSMVAEPTTFGATSHFGGPLDTLSVRRLAVHVLPPGGYGYDLAHLQPTFGGVAQPAPDISARAYPAFGTPSTAGPLLLSGGIVGDASGAVVSRFRSAAGGEGARIVVLTAGYARSTDAQADAKVLAAALQPGVFAPVRWYVLDSRSDAAAISAAVRDATGILVTAPDQSRVLSAFSARSAIVDAVRARWTAGHALLADNAAAAALGPWLTTDATPSSSSLEPDSQADFLVAGVTVAPGLGWVSGLSVEPRLLPDQHWGRLANLAARHPAVLAAGIDGGTALELSAGSARTRGSSAAVVFDGRYATFGEGTNGALAARWLVADSFVEGETLEP
jgi:cyanophycinase-like exopeptidase